MPPTTKPTKVKQTDTKADIWAALKEKEKELKDLKAQKLNPTAAKASKRKKEVLQKAKGINLDSISKAADTLRTRFTGAIDDINQQLQEKLGELEVITETIKLRDEENQEVLGISREAETLAALVETQSEKKATFDEYMRDQKADFQQEMADERETWEREQATHERDWKDKVKLAAQEQKRQNDEFVYNFKRQQMVETDKLRDQLKVERTKWQEERAAQERALTEREEAVAKQEQAFNQMTALVEELQAKLVTDVEAAAETAKKKAAQSYGIELNAVKKGNEADQRVLQGQIDSLTTENTRLSSQVDTLQARLDEAYAKVQNVAVEALRADGNAATVQAVSEVAKNTGNRR